MDNHVPGPRRIHKIYHRPKSEKSECVIKYQLIFFLYKRLKIKIGFTTILRLGQNIYIYVYNIIGRFC